MTVPASDVLPSPRQRQRVGNMITVASGKGGVGKTWFSTTLSHALAFDGQRVLLFDGDLGLANVDVHLGITPEWDLASVLAERVGLEEAVVKFAGGSGSRGGYDILAGRSGSGALGTLNRAELQRISRGLVGLAPSYDWLIIDLAAGIDAAATTLSAPSGLIYVILTDEPTSLTDAYAFIKVMAQRDAKVPVEVVVNMASDVAEGKRTYKSIAHACKTFLGFEPPLAGIVRRDEKVKMAIRQQSPILSKYPKSPAGEDIMAVAEKTRGG
ncbi:MAG: MinD/ParA family protein [Pseudomonadota bacterium]